MTGEGKRAALKAAIVLKGLCRERSVRGLCREYRISRATYYRWQAAFIAGGIERLAGTRRDRQTLAELAEAQRKLRQLARECQALQGENLLLRGRIALRLITAADRRSLGREERRAVAALVRASHLSLRRALRVLGLPRSTFYSWLRAEGGSGSPP